MVNFSSKQNICNYRMDSEYIASKFYCGLLYPGSYVDLRNSLSKIQFIDDQGVLDDLCFLLQKIVASEDLLIEEEVDKYWQGNNQKVYAVMLKLGSASNEAILLNKQAMEDHLLEMEDDFATQLPGETREGYAFTINTLTAKTQNREAELTAMEDKLKRNKANIDRVIRLYGSGSGNKLPTKKIKAEFSKSYSNFVNTLVQSMDKYVSNIDLASIITDIFASGAPFYPEDDLDPYLIDEYNSYLKAITNPKDYYKLCTKDKIISEVVGAAFYKSMPEFAGHFFDKHSDDINKMDYQEQIEFLREFGMSNVDPSLLQFCMKTQAMNPQQGAQ